MLLKKTIPMRYVLGKIRTELILVTLYATAFSIFHFFYGSISLEIPIAVPTMVGTVISLLLAFKSNQAYDRWWEARIIWGAIVNDSRTLLRQVIAFYKDPDFSDEANNYREGFAKRQSAWCYSLAQSLRGKDPFKGIHGLLSEEELSFLKRHTNVPNAILMLHAKHLTKAMQKDKINTFQQVEIDNTLTRLCDSMGKGERIKNTIFPTTYSMYIRFTLCLFVILLPFGLVQQVGLLLQVPIVITLGAAFFLIEKMAIHLQDPFESRPTDTPMTAICNNIEKNLFQMVNEFRDEYENEIPEMNTPHHIQPVANTYFVL